MWVRTRILLRRCPPGIGNLFGATSIPGIAPADTESLLTVAMADGASNTSLAFEIPTQITDASVRGAFHSVVRHVDAGGNGIHL